MKPPATPDYTKNDLSRALERIRDPEVLDAVFHENARYLHWDEIRRRKKYPAEPLVIWILMKYFRDKNARRINFRDWTFQYLLSDSCWKELHSLDKTAPETLSSILDSTGTGREQYLVNSLMEEAIATSQLDGAATTRQVAKQMLRERRKPRNRDERMIVNSYLTMKEVRSLTKEPLTRDLILRLHAMITSGTLDDSGNEGIFRDNDKTRVIDGSCTVLSTPLPHTEIPGLIGALCQFANEEQDEFMHPVVKGIVLHFLLAYLHPFDDGNGRCARTLFYWFVLKHQYWIFEFLAISRIIRDTRRQYRKAYLYTDSDGNDLTYFIRYNLGVIGTAIKELERYAREQQEAQTELLLLVREREEITLRQSDILMQCMKDPGKPVTIREVMETYQAAYGTARSDLLKLVDVGYLKKEKPGKETLFFFKGIPPKVTRNDAK
jgi:Fic family protein